MTTIKGELLTSEPPHSSSDERQNESNSTILVLGGPLCLVTSRSVSTGFFPLECRFGKKCQTKRTKKWPHVEKNGVYMHLCKADQSCRCLGWFLWTPVV